MVEAERVSGQRDGSVTKDARMKPSARATGMLCASGRAHRAFRMTETRSEPTHCAVAEMRADRKRTREVVGVTRMHVEMVGTPRGVPLVRSFGASVVLCDAQVAVSAGDGFTFSSTTRDESGGCAAQTAARGVEGEARARDEQVGIAYARAEALRSRVDVGRARRRSARTSALVQYANETRARGNAQLYPNQSHDGVFFLATFTRTRLPVVRSTSRPTS